MSKKVDDDRSDKEVLKEYQGVHLVEKEFEAMKDLEKVIGEIPYLEDFAYDENGFSAENGHVKNLNLSNLELDHIPESIGNLQELEALMLVDNNLTEMPDTVSQLENLNYFTIWGNEIKDPIKFGNRIPEIFSILECDLEVIVDFINSHQFQDDFLLMIEEGIMEDPLMFISSFDKKFWKEHPLDDKELLIEVISALNRFIHIAEEYNNYDDIFAQDFYIVEIYFRELLDTSWKHLKYHLIKEEWKFEFERSAGQKDGELYNYHGIDLYLNEYVTMMELENLIGEEIPHFVEDPELHNSYVNDEDGCYFHDVCAFGFVGYEGHVKKLSITEKSMEFLPESTGNLSELISLHLSKNLLGFLPKSIGELENLRFLEVCHNELTRLPDQIGELQNLEDLWLMDNRLKDLPASMEQMDKLYNISIMGNPAPFNLAENLPDRVKEILKKINCEIMDNEGITFASELDEE